MKTTQESGHKAFILTVSAQFIVAQQQTYLYDSLWCEAGDYCYAEDEFGNEVEFYYDY